MSIIIGLLLAGCGAQKNNFVLTKHEMFEKVTQETALGEKIEAWLKSKEGYSCEKGETSCPKSIVLMNMEKDGYQNDQKPEAVLHDVLIDRLTNPEYNVRILDRDSNSLNFIHNEVNAIELPTKIPVKEKSNELELAKLKELKARQGRIADLISQVALILSPQDTLFFNEATSTKTENALEKTYEKMPVISNEMGKNKADLLKHLVDQYIHLHQCEGDFCNNLNVTVEPEAPAPVVDVERAEYLFAYRIYNLEDSIEKSLGSKVRKTRLKIHVRIINVKTGEIEVADTLEHELVETDSVFEKKEKKEKKEQAPLNAFSSLEFSIKPNALDINVLQDPQSSIMQGNMAAHVYSDNGFRGSLGFGLGYSSDADASAQGGESINSNALMWSASGTIDKVIFPRKAVKGLLGVGVKYSGISANETIKGLTTEDPNGNVETQSDSAYGVSSSRVDLIGDVGLMYSFKQFALEFGYQYPLYSLYSNTSVDIDDNTDILQNALVPPPTIRIGLHYTFCGVVPLPNAFGYGQTCQPKQD